MDVFHSIDPETGSLILQLQIEDSKALSPPAKAKGKASKASSTTPSVDVPLALTEGGASDEEEELDDEVLEKLNALYICAADEDSDSHLEDENGDEDDSKALVPYHSTSSLSESPIRSTPTQHHLHHSLDAESSRWAASRIFKGPTNRHCTACRETFPISKLSRVPCTHEYCRDCLQDLFHASITDDTLFPPLCCRQPITPTTSIRIYLTAFLVQQYEAKKIEFDTPDRTYCSDPLCSSFIRTEFIVEEGGTCQLVLETARENEWQRCYNCHRLVELDTGCNHMTCTCHAQFCYKCGERWKTCRCAQWDEHRLYARAEIVVARQPAVQQHLQQAPEQRLARFAAVVQDLLDRHGCDHGSWRWVRGPHECEECRHDLPDYIFECRQCHIRACNRCRRNRL
ncbi:IBR finger domain protein [Rhexocercosporidium sp. MPI-PUGE-AT-0058]|nr:IBR finger domain protein [Rhexocercosporidium sp. MPI-PUGE-AT-0058]